MSLCVLIPSQLKFLVSMLFFIFCDYFLQIKASHNNKGPYDFAQPQMLQELGGEHTVSSTRPEGSGSSFHCLCNNEHHLLFMHSQTFVVSAHCTELVFLPLNIWLGPLQIWPSPKTVHLALLRFYFRPCKSVVIIYNV